MSPEQLQLKQRLIADKPEALVSELILERVPHLFEDNWVELRQWRLRLSGYLEVDPCDIIIIGSAAVGHSLNPHKGLRAFDDGSDIDVAIISPYHFDIAWRTIRAKRKSQVSEQTWRSIESHKRNYVFMGCVACDQILSILPFASQWMDGFSKMSLESPTEERNISARIYRDFGSLRSYQASGIETLKSGLMS